MPTFSNHQQKLQIFIIRSDTIFKVQEALRDEMEYSNVDYIFPTTFKIFRKCFKYQSILGSNAVLGSRLSQTVGQSIQILFFDFSYWLPFLLREKQLQILVNLRVRTPFLGCGRSQTLQQSTQMFLIFLTICQHFTSLVRTKFQSIYMFGRQRFLGCHKILIS